jgi:hypothetical protein
MVPAPSATPATVEPWKQALDLQKHFNDILFRIRGLAFAFGGAAVAFAMTRPEAPAVLSSWRGAGARDALDRALRDGSRLLP